ncbi:tRNA (5-methylaminomethyl-2-thiouridine)(34)-methyltransferase MnmD [Hymenobacter psychrophilus]|uniref:tRNA U34 5-methylaminomethyl-2-thiouridine-forming methyltransferase MnmC n=1 Tax=Hymenobacter psychrophilus TaxID=651662 RepID=A0A1H3HN11_9BACT|nr:tRNA (5-methylaminomethyl-2-thiouridine)(34)-methyltransferase MnmD [Hymenobacter psychrophilus]SDY16852.1 tRNA U34 5-methylaminomethyl-2-thiouridine-forming methyltransferase MnmC [Hymenobacter psychrophilus]
MHPDVQLRPTADGSGTLYVPALDEHYHSTHGAVQEARHVYLAAGLEPALAAATGPVRALEVGFGTGLNALLTLERSLTAAVPIQYDTVEKHPLPWELVRELATAPALQVPPLPAFRQQLHEAAWEQPVALTPSFMLRKLAGELQNLALVTGAYEVIYFDAFAPDKQPDMWTDAVFGQLYAAAAPGGCLVSYCAKGSFKRSLRAAGWQTEAIPGPPGKREMTRAWKR